ncbi:unnamed protein product [Triticum turgidum subsp. durum]|uniref:Aminotransferase-like plant mobile domain-containing protein n=1 Tax=Triticum turgidum subsp. durum TaxID=4567 RepID=A0A9R1S0S1_TRITD|nr:unnamed protein product [Triticum turgidum subsp. durum]
MTDFFSGIQAGMVVNRLENSEQSPEDWNSDGDGSGGTTGLLESPCFTSRLSVLKVGSVISKFSEFKCQLVRETGFDGMLEIKSWQKINLKYNAYIMDRVDVDSRIINLERQGVIELCDKDMNYVFGIPCGDSTIEGEGVEPSVACIEYTRAAASFSDRGTHSLKAAEAYLSRCIAESSTQLEQDCFKIAFVIFVVGHVLAPTAKHDYILIDFWAALNDISKIKDWNWGGYVLKNLFQAVKKFKADVLRRNPTVHIVGCHLFLQLFVLDSLELGVLNRARGVTPRIGLYDYESIKNMVEKITVNSAPCEVSFHGAPVRSELSVRNLSVCRPKEVCATNTPKPTTAPKKANATCTPIPRNSYAKTDAQEFSNYIRTRYPSISTEKLGVLLREQNARGLANISEMRQAFQSNMFTFTDKLMICIADSCTCCKAHGSKRCILKREDTNTDNVPPMASVDQTQFSTPLVSKIGPRLPAPGNHEGTVSANSHVSRKRDGSLSSSVQSGTSKKTYSRDQQAIVALTPTYSQSPHNQNPISQDRTIMEIASNIVAFYDDLTAILVTYYAEIRPTPAFVLFGSTTDGVPLKIDLPQCNFGRDPWVAGSVPAPPIPTVLRAIRDWMTGASMLNLERKWIVHPKPRLISLDGVEIHRQLVLNDPMTHEMATAIFHRLGQIDMLFSKDTPRHIWRKFVEPDFATTILANADPLTVQSIRTSFQEGTSSCNPASCRMWYISAILPDSWTVYAFDMLRKRIIVLDPAVGPFGYSNRRVSMHEFVSNKLHAALFNCLEKFFSSWHC